MNGTPQASTSAATLTPENAKVNDYLVGTHLDEAIAAGHEVDVFWPFADGDINDWTQAEAVWCVPRQIHAWNLHL